MAKRQLYDNYRVVAYTPVPFGRSTSDHKLMLSWTKDLQKEIQRHCDHGSTDIEVDSVPECEFCGSKWTEVSDTYNGGCCDKDEEGNA